ncbi:uncharacterized protein [Spinacia oleracea]|uniref:Uncharacterized protein isoform X2 n=1 Tax=Spinacia oleracea TaxID=3562 RepID=A0ABM3QJI6_SPIOL|nr:uncharacterized protein LOC110800631 isoform X2 [Spinacia oleracea]XP_056683527.1 uncharacterized protein LOC110800631 isoform X2 [Spinacia oleracea]
MKSAVFSSMIFFELTTSTRGDDNSKLFNFTQRVDHFGSSNLGNLTFTQNLLVDDTRWGGAQTRAPIFVLFGGEDGELFAPERYGTLAKSADEFKAMIIHIQHRFYGDSIPLGTIESAMADHQVRSCLATDQALQDYAVIIQSLKVNYSARNSPVIVMGIGYAGALATWFRLRYPEIAIGALASSTPLLYYGNSTTSDGYCSIVSNDFKDVNPKCYESIRRSWKEIDDIAIKPNGLAELTNIFNTCRPLQSSEEIKHWLAQMYSAAVQYDEPNNLGVKTICDYAVNKPSSIDGVATAIRGKLIMENCLQNHIIGVKSPFEPFANDTVAWEWQRCNELIFPVGCLEETMLPAKPFNFIEFKKSCQSRFGVLPNPHSPISFFGSKNIIESLTGFGGNIIFSNGLRDPFSSGSILQDLSKTIVAIKTTEGTTCMDMTSSNLDFNDPEWLIAQRKQELDIFKDWIDHFHHISGSYPTSFSLFITYCLQILVFSFMTL